MKDKIKSELDQLIHAIAQQRRSADSGSAIAMLKVRVAFQAIVDAADDVDAESGKVIRMLAAALAGMEQQLESELWENDHYTRMLIENVNKSVKELPEPQADQNVHKQNDPAVREAVLKITDGKCAYCGCDLKTEHHGSDAFVVEHVVPKSKGGPDNIVNFVPSCRGCNNAKSDRHVYHFISNVLPYRMAKAGGAS